MMWNFVYESIDGAIKLIAIDIKNDDALYRKK